MTLKCEASRQRGPPPHSRNFRGAQGSQNPAPVPLLWETCTLTAHPLPEIAHGDLSPLPSLGWDGKEGPAGTSSNHPAPTPKLTAGWHRLPLFGPDASPSWATPRLVAFITLPVPPPLTQSSHLPEPLVCTRQDGEEKEVQRCWNSPLPPLQWRLRYPHDWCLFLHSQLQTSPKPPRPLLPCHCSHWFIIP